MHGRESEEKRRSVWHMWPVPPAHGNATGKQQQSQPQQQQQLPVSTSLITYSNKNKFFIKDGRKIRVGDCALFQSGNSPAFIGIIRWFSSGKEGCLKLRVNWLYRPADVKLAKGTSLEAAPNEIFYSFHKDEISAQSLLHPCKVAFLRKGVDQPSRISSFVCRRVYDITNKCLWWLTDQDYINECQEEVDQLLDKAWLEMHATVQSGGRSPKSLTVPSSVQPLKSGSDSVQNSVTSVSLQGKGKRREKVEQGSETMKKDLTHKTGNGNSGNCVLDGKIKAEVTKITNNGALTYTDEVDKLVHLLQLDKGERRIELSGRILLADVIASTDNFDCLTRFVQLKGVLVLDDWLQEAHKGKIGDSTSPKESDKSVDELLLALLQALDKLPVNLHALQTSNIGKSVNHLRSHKNLEIQKKARSLVDTWKKRVDAEMMKISDVKPGLSEGCQGGNKHTGSSDPAIKTPFTQLSTGKNLPIKPGHGDINVKSPPTPPGSLKLPSTGPIAVVSCSKDVQCKMARGSRSSELLLTPIKEEKSSESSQSLNNSQSISSGHAKDSSTSWKEDARRSTTGSMKAGKSGGMSRHRRSNNGFSGTGPSGGLKEVNISKSSPFNRNMASSRVSHSVISSERSIDLPVSDHGSGHRLIVRLPNPGRSPQSTSGGSIEEPSTTVGSRVSSPVASEKQEQNEHKIKVRVNASQATFAVGANTESLQSTISDLGGRILSSPIEAHKNINENGKAEDEVMAASSLSANEKEPSLTDSKLGKSCDPSFSSINALIESCAKYSESAVDDIGMNLLACVATGEMCKPVLTSPTTGAIGSLPIPENHSNATEKFTHGEHKESSIKLGATLIGEDPIPTSPVHVKENDMEIDGAKQENLKVDMQSGNDSVANKHSVRNPLLEKPMLTNCAWEKSAEHRRSVSSFSCSSLVDGGGKTHAASGKTLQNEEFKELQHWPSDVDIEHTHVVNEGSNTATDTVEKPTDSSTVKMEVVSSTKDEQSSSSSAIIINSENSESMKKVMPGIINNVVIGNHLESSDSDKEQVSATLSASVHCAKPVLCLAKEDSHTKEVHKKLTAVSDRQEEVPSGTITEVEQSAKSTSLRVSEPEIDEIELSCHAYASSLPNSMEQDIAAKHGFDLNEGICSDEISQGETATSAPLRCSPAVPHPVLTPFVITTMSGGSSVPITVASPAKGPFVPPENLFVCKGELGWKGSAATSAFRPAEPRKVFEMSISMHEASDTTARKKIRQTLDIDLNVADEQIPDYIASQNSTREFACESEATITHDTSVRNAVCLDLDLNKVDEITENGQLLASTSMAVEATFLPVKPESGASRNGYTSISRDFDLNNGPCFDEICAEPISRNQHMKNSGMSFVAPVGRRMNNTELGNMSPWFLPGSACSAVAIPSFMPDRGDQTYPMVNTPVGAQRFLGSATGSFAGDTYRNSMLSSSPALAFSPASSFPYATYPFGSSFPLASASITGGSTTYVDSSSGGGSGFPAIPSRHIGSPNAGGSAYSKPNMMSLQECSTSGLPESCRKWGRQSLDLNAGPGSIDVEGRDDRSASSRQFSDSRSHTFAEEQARIYQEANGSLKRKEPEGGWEAERYSYRYSSWQ